MSTQPSVPAIQRTPFGQFLQRIFGEDQAKGIEHLAKASDFLQALEKPGVRSTPYCAIVPQWTETLRSNIQGLDDAVKVALVKLLNLLVTAREGRGKGTKVTEPASAPNGFTWEELQSLCMQASFLEPVNDKQPAPKSIQKAGKRKICWLKKYAEPGIPKSHSIFELLRADGVEKDSRSSDDLEIDLTPLRLLLDKAEAPKPKRKQSLAPPSFRPRPKQTRSLSVDSAGPNSTILGSIEHRSQGTAAPNSFQAIQEEPDEALPPTFNVSSAQKYALSWKASQSPSSWTALELITLRFPSTKEESNFAISRLTVTAWTSFDHRLIIPRSQTVVRIESLSREFRARKEFINMLPDDRRQAAIAEAEALFKHRP